MKTQSAPQIGLSSSEDFIADLVLPEYWTQEERCNSQNSPSVPVYFATGVAVIGLRLTFKVKPPPLVEWSRQRAHIGNSRAPFRTSPTQFPYLAIHSRMGERGLCDQRTS